MYSENIETLSISLPAFLVKFINNYISTHQNKSPSVVIQDALQLLLAQEERQQVAGNAALLFEKKQQVLELEQAYRDAAQEFDTNWEITVMDGLSNEKWWRNELL
jgi:metal-responsive CopG/Arc/MetJ family transcriptional regulator